MAIALYMDHHVPRAVTEGLRRHGVDVITSLEDGTETAADDTILARAAELDRVVYTQDDDFLLIAATWSAGGRDFPVSCSRVSWELPSGRQSTTCN